MKLTLQMSQKSCEVKGKSCGCGAVTYLKMQKKLGLDVMMGVMVHEGLPVMIYEAEIMETSSMADGMTRHGL